MIALLLFLRAQTLTLSLNYDDNGLPTGYVLAVIA